MSSGHIDELGGAIARFRDLRRRFEEAIPATAVSVDGRSFVYRIAIGDSVPPPGGFVALVDGDVRRVGQLITQELVTRDGPEVGASLDGQGLAGDNPLALQATVKVRVVEGEGVVLSGDGVPFVDALIEDAGGAEIAAVAGPRPDTTDLVIGTVLARSEELVPARIDAAGFDRHTFLCGQSGSGKTYSLGLVLEQLLLDTELRIVVIDPNSDFVRLREARSAADPAAAARLEELAPSILVRRPGAIGDDRLRLRFSELDGAAYGGVLRLDPIRDADEYEMLLRVLEREGGTGMYQALAADVEPAEQGRIGPLIRRVRNLGIDRWGVWAREQAGTVLEDLDRDDWRCLVIDIGTLGTPVEKTLVAQAVLARLWARRLERKPLLIVIDEAHNVCPQLPEGELQFLATEASIRIAAEGRKYGLYLLLSTQRPQKVHENIVSQCDNLLLMRMNSAADVGHLTELFSFVPPSLLARATGFRQGEALVAGKIVPAPTLIRFGARLSEEGGSDVPADSGTPYFEGRWMTTLRYVVADVFTDTPLTGNQLAVFTDARELDDATMQALALEVGFSETVFVLSPENGGTARMRIFTPYFELPFAGHPTLGTAFVLGAPLQLAVITLETGRGNVPVVLERDESGRIVFGRMEQPVPTVDSFSDGAALFEALGVEGSELPVERYDNGATHLFVTLPSEEAVMALRPDIAAVRAFGVTGVSCFAGGGTEWTTRMFWRGGEDAATGSAAGPLACHLARHGCIAWGDEITISQGAAIGRPSTLYARAEGGAGLIDRVEVGGQAVTVARGEFRL